MLINIIFQTATRTFKGKRWAKIILRTAHLLGMTGVGSSIFCSSVQAEQIPFLYLLFISGILFVAIELWSNGVYLIQVRGLVIYIKLFLLLLLSHSEALRMPVLFTIIILSGVISHAPGDLRYYSMFHRKKLESL